MNSHVKDILGGFGLLPLVLEYRLWEEKTEQRGCSLWGKVARCGGYTTL